MTPDRDAREPVSWTTAAELVRGYSAVLLDAYGVLVDESTALPGAVRLLERLEATAKPYYVLTNDASRSREACAQRFQSLGLAIPPERVLSSSGLLRDYVARHDLRGAGCLVLGGDDARASVQSLGLRLIDATAWDELEVVVVSGVLGYDLVACVDDALSAVFRRLDQGHAVHLLAPNPDVIYPKGNGDVGVTAGGLAALLETGLEQRWPGTRFLRLGKPHEAIFAEAEKLAGTRDLVMIGDQLPTDIRGAANYGIDSALVMTGLTTPAELRRSAVRPTYLLASL